MPCDSITTQSINLANAIKSVLTEALHQDGWTIEDQNATNIWASKDWQNLIWTKATGLRISGVSTIRAQGIVEEVTQAYSRHAVTWAAQRAGWTARETSPNTLTVERR